MPELPEVECLTNAVRSLALNGQVEKVEFFRADLRAPIPVKDMKKLVRGTINAIERRSKYMLWEVDALHYGIFHLGMSGNFLLHDSPKPKMKHTHAVFSIHGEKDDTFYLHFVDPRRFGRIDYCKKTDLAKHRLFKYLGPEPLTMKNLGEHLFQKSRRRTQPIKNFLMDAKNVVGVGNIYASEALFRAGINPRKLAGRVSKAQFEDLAVRIKETLREAIKAGGTTFRDFKNADGESGYFVLKLAVYNRKGETCGQCGDKIRLIRQAGRSSFFCPTCQR